MKIYFNLFKFFFTLILLFSIHTVSLSQPPPPPAAAHGTAANSPAGAGAAPIGEGMFLLLGLAGLYGGKKIYDLRKPLKEKV